MVEFVSYNGATAIRDKEAKKTIRSQAMRDFRRRQRDEELILLRNNQGRSGSSRKQQSRRLLPAEKAHPDLKHCTTATSDTPNTDHTQGRRENRPRNVGDCLDKFGEGTFAGDAVQLDDTHEVKPHKYYKTDNGRLPQKSRKIVTLRHGYTGDADDVLFQAMVDSTPSLALGRPDLSRDQLWQAFINSYYSDPVILANGNFLNEYKGLALKGMAFAASRDALCLIHLGARHDDERLLNEGRKIHCVALRLIRESLNKPKDHSSDSILGACYTIAHCQIYQEIAELGRGWRIHMDGLYYLLEMRGSDSLSSPFARAIFHNIRQIAVMDQLLKRKRSFLSSQPWLDIMDGAQHPAFELTNIALKISELLDNADQVITTWDKSSACLQRKLVELVHTYTTLEDNLIRWLSNFYDRAATTRVLYKVDSISQYPRFEQRCGNSAPLVRHVYTFTSLLSATVHTYVWICLLALRMSFAQITALTEPSSMRRTFVAVVQDANECASHLCRSLAFLSLQEHRSAGLLACSGPLYWAEIWYESRNEIERVQFCKRIRQSLQQECHTPLNLQFPVFTWWMLPGIDNAH